MKAFAWLAMAAVAAWAAYEARYGGCDCAAVRRRLWAANRELGQWQREARYWHSIAHSDTYLKADSKETTDA